MGHSDVGISTNKEGEGDVSAYRRDKVRQVIGRKLGFSTLSDSAYQ